MRKISILLVGLWFSLILVSCDGYNDVMADYLSNIDNYVETNGVLKEIIFYDEAWDELDWEMDESLPTYYEYVHILIAFEDKDEYLKFSGTESIADDFDYQSHLIRFELIKDNIGILDSNGFFDDISLDQTIHFTTSDLIYSDTNYFEIIDVNYEENAYLSSEVGFNNYMLYIEKHRSLF